ncbi:MAG: YdeI/OmpD-associated family protein [Gemmatimonadales bacterium]
MTTPAPIPRAFRSQAAFRAWLAAHHAVTPELLVRLFKTSAAHRGLTYAQALDEALCHGWIDGVRRRFDAESFTIRFTPRKPRSTWSRVNVAHVERLIAAGRMAKAGLAAYAAREEVRTGLYSFERRAMPLAPEYARAFRANARAWTFFQGEAPWYRRICTYWVMSAKKEETRDRRIAQLIACSARRQRIPQLARP